MYTEDVPTELHRNIYNSAMLDDWRKVECFHDHHYNYSWKERIIYYIVVEKEISDHTSAEHSYCDDRMTDGWYMKDIVEHLNVAETFQYRWHVLICVIVCKNRQENNRGLW